MTAAVSERSGLSASGVRADPTERSDAAFTDFYQRHYGPVTGYALSLVADETIAADVAQEAFTRLYLRWQRVNDPRAWLFFIATNLTRDHWRNVQRDRKLTMALHPPDLHTATGHDPWLRDLVERLPSRLRQPVLLHYYADLSVDDIARLMHRPVGSIKQRLHQARKELAMAVRDTQ